MQLKYFSLFFKTNLFPYCWNWLISTLEKINTNNVYHRVIIQKIFKFNFFSLFKLTRDLKYKLKLEFDHRFSNIFDKFYLLVYLNKISPCV